MKEKQILAKSEKSKAKIVATHAGIVRKVDDYEIIVKDKDFRTVDYEIELGTSLLVKT